MHLRQFLHELNARLRLRLQFQDIKWKNVCAQPGEAYQPTDLEQTVNVLTHGILIIPAIVCATTLFQRSYTASQHLVSLVYGSALCLLFTVSTCFHCSCYCLKKLRSENRKMYMSWNLYALLKNILHRCDRAMIYIFIASSYFPWLQLEATRYTKTFLCLEWIIWIMAAIGITYQQLYHERYKSLETCFYIIMGLGPALAVVLTGHDFPGMTELKLGGFLYILGIVFFKSDGIIPMAHAIWHLFVVLAAACHYYGILTHLYPPKNFNNM